MLNTETIERTRAAPARASDRAFPMRALALGMLMTLALAGGGAWVALRLHDDFKTLATTDLRLYQLDGSIMHLDEVLTMSARMAAATGDAKWEMRYHAYEPQLDAAIKEVIALAPETFMTASAESTDAANVALVEMEGRALELVRAGNAAAASRVLFSSEYEKQKAIYARGMAEISTAIVGRADEQMEAQSDRVGVVGIVAGILLLGVCFSWLKIISLIKRYLGARAAAEEALSRANASLEATVAQRTAALRESEERFRTLSDSSPIGILEVDSAGAVTHANPKVAEILGRADSALIGNAWSEGVLDADRKNVCDWHARIEGAGTWREELRVAQPEGPVRWVEACGTRVQSDSQVGRYVLTLQDITERKDAAARADKMQRELVSTSRLAGMAEVAVGVLHNVGNVLNSLNVSATVIEDKLKASKVPALVKAVALFDEHGADLPAFIVSEKGRMLPTFLAKAASHLVDEKDAMQRELAHIRKNVDHIKTIVGTQQSYAKNVGRTGQPVSLAALVEDALRMSDTSIDDQRIALHTELDAVPEVLSDKHRIMQVLLNLISNARHALKDGAKGHKELRVRVHRSGDDYVTVAVSDNGVGISTENLTRIFEHGFTTKKDGHGFGLHSSANAAKELGGSISVHSEGVGLGAVFSLHIPLGSQRIHAKAA